MLTDVHIWTDGSVTTNPGPAGYAAVLVHNQAARIVGGHNRHATNNVAETEAVCLALSALKKPCRAIFNTDSMYVIYGMQRVLENIKYGKKRLPKTNTEVWEDVRSLVGKHSIIMLKAEGHSGDPFNDLADYYAGICAFKQTNVDFLVADYTTILDAPKKKKAFRYAY
jgi:ribonuclease HI